MFCFVFCFFFLYSLALYSLGTRHPAPNKYTHKTYSCWWMPGLSLACFLPTFFLILNYSIYFLPLGFYLSLFMHIFSFLLILCMPAPFFSCSLILSSQIVSPIYSFCHPAPPILSPAIYWLFSFLLDQLGVLDRKSNTASQSKINTT